MNNSLTLQPKRVAFDIGNVLCHVDLDMFFNSLVNEKVVESKELANDLVKSIQHSQDLGIYNIKQCLQNYELDINVVNRLYDVWLSIVSPSDAMLYLLDELINKYGYEVSLLSNIGFDHSEIIRQKCPIFEKCNQHFSYEVGARKPTKLYFQSFILQYQWGKDVLFFDDCLDNVKAANGYLTGIQFDIENYESDKCAEVVIRNYLKL
jgi:FMN phosphatase YigB (HAD superfamily)